MTLPISLTFLNFIEMELSSVNSIFFWILLFKSFQFVYPLVCVCACMLSHFSRVRLCATLWTAAHQAPLYVRFSRQEYGSGLPCPPPGDLPDPGIEPVFLTSPALAGRFFTTCATWGAPSMNRSQLIYSFCSLWAISSFQVGDNYKLVLLWMLQYKSFYKRTCTFCWVSA